MTTDEVVSTLIRDLKPVSPLPTPTARAWAWGMIVFVTGGMAAAVIGLRPDLARVATALNFQAHTVFLISATALAGGAALLLAIPGERLSRAHQFVPIAAAGCWIAWLLVELASTVGRSPAAWTIDFGWGCVGKAVTIAAVPGAVLLLMVGRSAPVEVRRAVTFAALASAGVGALGVEITCPNTDAMHLLIWHAGPMVALPVVAAVAGAPLFVLWMRRREAAHP